MMKPLRLILVFISFILACSPCQAKDCILTEKQMDIYLGRLEKALPVLEKQAGAIAELLQTEKGVEEIRHELQRLQGYTDLPGERTLLYGELDLHKANDDFFLRGKKYIPFYSLEILHDLTNGGCYSSISYDKALRDTPQEQWTRAAGIMDAMLKILVPLNDIVAERLSKEETLVVQGWRCELLPGTHVPFASCLYSAMFTVTDVMAQTNSPLRYYTNARDRIRIMNIMKEAGTPPVHLEMVKNYFAYLALRQGNADWDSPIAAIDQMVHYLKTGQGNIAESEGNRLEPVTEFEGF